MNSYFLRACEDGDLQTVCSYTESNTDDNMAIGLAFASREGHFNIVRHLLSNPRVNMFEYTYLSIVWASEFGHSEIVTLILSDNRINPAAVNNMAIQKASLKGHLEVVRLLLADPRVNPKGEEGIYISLDNSNYIEIAVIDDILCRVKNGDTESIEDEGIRAKFVKWQYRLGGEKYTASLKSLEK